LLIRMSAPMRVRMPITPVRVGFMPTCSTPDCYRRDTAPTRKKAAEEISAGMSMEMPCIDARLQDTRARLHAARDTPCRPACVRCDRG
jgi:hypothetical protein